ncbi:putative protein N(5)-glutamine methyltransferase [Paenarthrobacter sp. Z7-10]|uniref:putative protein N(5)-glutamine methyltransferase n=1 Tax=Paenarthrobacter sp. Z7-10 TaxID=2787635 RepID=UPI003FA72134
MPIGRREGLFISSFESTLLRSVLIGKLRAAGCVFAEDEAELLLAAAQNPADLAAMADRRVAGLPLEHVLGWAEFCGLRITVDAGVFVPRRRTGFLVRQAADLARPGAVIVDLCCGSGAVGAALQAIVPGARVYATDIDPAAVRCAGSNLAGGGGQVFAGDLFEPLPAALLGQVDVLVANAPYVPTDAIAMMPREARLHEAHVALDGGGDGCDVQRRVAAGAGPWLAHGGTVLLETSAGQASTSMEIFARNGFGTRQVSSAAFDATVVIGTKAGSK